MKNRIITSQQRKDQKQALKDALKEESKQFGAIKRLKTIAEKYDSFNLSDFQTILIDNVNQYFYYIISQYSKTQKRKAKQAQLIAQLEDGKNVELITQTSFTIYYKGLKKTYKTEQACKDHAKKERIKKYDIEKTVSPISHKFKPKEMLGILQKIEAKFFDTYSEPKTVTVAMVKTALSEKVTKKDKENVKAKKGTEKIKDKKAA